MVRKVAAAEKVTLQCVTPFDYELLRLEHEYFEDSILTQGAVVVIQQLLPVWLRQQSTPIHLKPLNIVPATVPFALMTVNTELEIEICPGVIGTVGPQKDAQGHDRLPSEIMEAPSDSEYLSPNGSSTTNGYRTPFAQSQEGDAISLLSGSRWDDLCRKSGIFAEDEEEAM